MWHNLVKYQSSRNIEKTTSLCALPFENLSSYLLYFIFCQDSPYRRKVETPLRDIPLSELPGGKYMINVLSTITLIITLFIHFTILCTFLSIILNGLRIWGKFNNKFGSALKSGSNQLNILVPFLTNRVYMWSWWLVWPKHGACTFWLIIILDKTFPQQSITKWIPLRMWLRANQTSQLYFQGSITYYPFWCSCF